MLRAGCGALTAMEIQDLIQTAMRHQQAGELTEAEKIYDEILRLQPEQPDALALLATIALRRGDIDAAIDLLGRAITSKPDFFDAHKSLGALLAKRGEFEKAIQSYQRALELRPADAKAHFDLGNILFRLNQLDGAIGAYSKAIELRPDFGEAHNNLGEALSRKGLADQAMESYRRAMMLKPEYLDRLNQIGRMLDEKGRMDEAIAAYLSIIELRPNIAQAHLNLGRALDAAGYADDAVAAYRGAAPVNPGGVEIHARMASLLAKLERFDEAMAAQASAAAIAPNSILTHEALGEIQMFRLNAAAAVESFRRALAIDPNSFSSCKHLGEALRSSGRFDEAAVCFRRLIDLRPEMPAGYAGLATVGRLNPGQPEMQRMLEMVDRPDLPVANRIAMQFALGKAFDAADRFDEAFQQYSAANSTLKRQRAAMGKVYDRESIHLQVDQIIDAFSREFFAKRRDWGDASETPVFIVGMPRSGTTLVQQIAAGHPGVRGAGETRAIHDIARGLRGDDFKTDTLGLDPNSVKNIASRHLHHLRAMHPEAQFIVDKLPSNVYRLGLIALLFPSARVIFCRRDARDTCLSCYFQNFLEVNAFSFDLADCGHEYLACNRLMDYWRQALPLRILEMQYEDLVADFEAQSRRLIEFLGLPWDPACLEFDRTPATILTSSDWQVRQPLYHRSVGRWHNYEKHLGPLFKVLYR
jgi:tetratricopeptide (TPR) repeat protein